MKATAVAPANIAFIKYWGKRDARLRLPFNPSISMNLSGCTTTTTVEFSSAYARDIITEGFDHARIIAHIDRVRQLAGILLRARIMTQNSFPKSAGIASSASGFAALTVAAAGALGLTLSEKELAALARLGSGSASRSIPDGFVKWEGEYAYSLYPHSHWDLRDIIVVVDKSTKGISSSGGHDRAESSPFFTTRLTSVPDRIVRAEKALKIRNLQLLGETMEEDCLDMHHVMQTQNPPLMYWSDKTNELMSAVRIWRKEGLSLYFTIDAGPNVHLICEGKDADSVMRRVQTLDGVKQIIVNKPSRGAHVTESHLF